MKNLFLLSVSLIAISLSTACQNPQAGKTQQAEQTPQAEQSRYYHWVCQQGEHQGAEILFVRINNVFRGEYADPGFQERIPIMGVIDDEGNVTAVSVLLRREGDIAGKLSGKITGDNFNAIWLPTPTGMEMSDFREMELVPNTADEQKNSQLPAPTEATFSDKPYGYTIGEWEMKLIHVARGTNDEVTLHLHIEESGIDDVVIDMQGVAQLNGNTFRYTENGYEFEIAAYNGFITLKTISGDWNGYKADGVYPEIPVDEDEMP